MKNYLLKALYKKQKFFETKTESDSDSDGSLSSDDEEEVSKDIIYKLFNNRYISLKYLGKGTFCRTWLMYDILDDKCVAMKMFLPKYYEDSKNELKINNLLTSNEYIVKLIDNFIVEGSTCLIYELLGLTLLDLSDYYERIPLNLVKKILIELFKGIDELHKQNIIHCDLKPENIMITQLEPSIQYIVDLIDSLLLKDKYCKMIEDNLPDTYNEFDKTKKKNVKRKIKKRCIPILIDYIKESLDLTSEVSIPCFILNEENIKCKLIDLGNSEVLGINNEDEIMIRSYRPPENIMNNFYNEKADIWTIGCIAYELITGEYLFDIDRDLCDTDKDKQHLHKMYEVLGKIPKDMALDCEYADELFDNQGRILNLKKCDYTSLDEIFKNEFNFSEKNSKESSDFLKHLLDYNIKQRYSSTDALNDTYLINS